MVGRSFAGYTCEERGQAGPYGEVFAARRGEGERARLLVVAPALASRPGFAAAAAAAAAELTGLFHEHVAAAAAAGTAGDGSLVIVTVAPHGVLLSALLERGPLPAAVGLSIGLDVLAGLARAHESGHCHGALHPRSVVIAGGRAIVDDFAVARGLIAAAGQDGGAGLLEPLRGYLAPELALGGAPSPAADVFAAGALLGELVGDAAGPALAAVLARAGKAAPGDRHRDAGALLAATEDAARRDGLEVAGAAAVAECAGGDALAAQTEDLLADIARASSRSRGVPGAGAMVGAVGLRRSTAERAVDELLADLSERQDSGQVDFDDDHTEVEESRRGDHLSKVLRSAEGELAAEERSPDDFEHDPTPLPTPRPFHDVTATVSIGAVPGSAADLSAEVELGRRGRPLLWLALIAFAAASVAVMVYTQRDFFSPEARRSRAAETERARAESLAEHMAAQAPAGEIVVASATEGAAVWLRLGATPVESFAVPMAMVHELRVEHDGYLPADLRVSAQNWSGEPGQRRALMSVSLVPGEAGQVAPAAPPPPQPLAPGGPGTGVIRVESEPPGAEVWLLVGFTPEVRIGGLPTDRGYELRALAEGHRPAAASVAPGDWLASDPGGPGTASVRRDLELEPLPGKRR